ncbi:hypothetical protein OSB04_un001308 [Centaurea solstitialis]|uniref:Retrotransposon gag domain-containing protein n=1 Tax=Centaurea solstitialis TaxID=347529 RepID=A0AA38SFT2_9ASTR|nr:hypothetical protein OSB04_un001308 [Centaurea solstitialis]
MIKDLTFDGKSESNPIVHMENFVDICDLFKTEEGRDDAIRLRVFPLTLTGEARAWLRSLEPSSITTWEGLRSKFLSRFFPPSKIDKLRAEIRSFQQQDGETISEAWERFKHLLNSCPSHELNKSEQVQTFYSGLAYSSRATLDSSAGGVFMYKTPTEGYKLLEDMLIHNIDWRTDKRLQIPRMAGKISTDFDPSDELAAMKNQQVKFERKIEELIKSVHALQVGCEECNGPHLTKDCPNKPMMTPEELNYINRGDYQGRWNHNRNFIPRPPGFFAPTQQNQRSDGEPRVTIEDRIIQFMDPQKKLNDEVGSYLRNHQSTIQNLELQVGRVSQMLNERTQGELPTQTQVNPKVENVKPMLMITGEPSKKKWTDIYTKKYVETESESEPDYATDYDSEGFTVSFEHLRLKVPEASSDEEDGKQGGYAEFVIQKKDDKDKEKEKEKEKAPEDDLIYIAPIKHDPDLEAVERKSTKKARKREKCTKSTQKTLGDREVLILAPPSSTEVQIRVDLITANLLEPFEEPEREFRKRNKKKSKATKVRPRALIFEMGDEAPMWTARRAAPTVPTNPITKPNLNKEIPGKLLHMIKDLTFDGKSDSNPIVHMENFVDICDLFKTEEGRDDAIRLRVFPLTLTGEARAWLRSLEPSSITTWEGLRSKFLSRFFPPSKIDKLRAEIRSFQQQDGETISEAWERFKHLLNSCPSHELNKSEQVQTFYSGLAYSSRATLDSSAGGVFMYKTPTEGYKLLEDMLIHNINWRTDKRLQIPRMAGKISTDFDPSDELAAMKNQQVKFERKIEELIKSVHALQVGCEECNGPHLTKDCPNKPMMTPEELNYINRGDYQGRWNNNRNFIPRPPGFFAPTQQNQRSDGEPRVSIEDRIIQFMDAQKKLNDEVGSYLRNHQSTIQNLELQVGRVSQMLNERT